MLAYSIFQNLPGFVIVITILFLINLLIAFTIIFLERKDPSATLAWIMILFLIPGVGIILYLLLSQNISRKKIFKLTRDEERLLTNSLAHQMEDISNGQFDFSNKEADIWKDLIRLNQVYGRSYFTQDNSIEVITDGEEMFETLLRDIGNANTSINVLYYILKNDEVGSKFIDALTAKAREGVKVRLLIDALGSRTITKTVLKDFVQAGGKYALFFPPKYTPFRWFNLKFNYRNHRKLVAIDDSIGHIGGFNIAKEYLGYKKKFGYWRDTQLRICGGSVQDINARFLMDWRFAAKEPVRVSDVFFAPLHSSGTSGIQIVSSGPDSEHERVKRGFMKMITSAQERIYIQTPYFIPDGPILESLKMAAQSGVDVRIMIPCKPDHILVYWGTYYYAGEIIKSGGKVYIYENGFLHAKTMSVDSQVATVGSTNFDRRSFRLNFESNAFIYGKEETEKLEAIFEEDMKLCKELTWEKYQERSSTIKVKEAIARLLSDIL